MKKFFLISVFALGLLAGCSKDEYNPNDISEGKGAVSLSLSSSGSFTNPSGGISGYDSGISLVTKSGEEADIDNFYVKILRNGVAIMTFEKYSEMPTSIEIAPGTYTMEAGSHGQSDAAFSQPIFYGVSDSFVVEAGKVVPVSVTCKLINMKVTIKYTEAFGREINSDFEIAVTNGKGNLIFDKTTIDNGISGYFTVGDLVLRLTATKRQGGDEVLHEVSIPGGAAQDHFVVTFDAQETGDVIFGGESGSQSGIIIDYTLNNKEQDIIIPGEDETPVEEPDVPGEGENPDGSDPSDPSDPANEYLPEITGDGIGTAKVVTAAEMNSANINVYLKTLNGKTIKDVIVDIQSDVLTADVLSVFFGSNKFSLVNTGNYTSNMQALGLIPADGEQPIEGRSEYTFKIGGFMPALFAIDKERISHKFIITLIDSDDKSTTETCTITLRD